MPGFYFTQGMIMSIHSFLKSSNTNSPLLTGAHSSLTKTRDWSPSARERNGRQDVTFNHSYLRLHLALPMTNSCSQSNYIPYSLCLFLQFLILYIEKWSRGLNYIMCTNPIAKSHSNACTFSIAQVSRTFNMYRWSICRWEKGVNENENGSRKTPLY